MLKALIFDFDGTIADTLPVCVNAFKKTVEPVVGHEMSLEEVYSYFGPSEEGLFEKHFPELQEKLCQEYFSHYAEFQKDVPEAAPGIMELVRDAKTQGIHVSLVTAKGRGSCQISLDFYGIADDFEYVYVGGAGGRIKDAAIREILEKTGIRAEECVYVGDSPKDVISAHKAGVACWAAAWFPSAEPEKILANSPEKIFYSVAEMRLELEKQGVLK